MSKEGEEMKDKFGKKPAKVALFLLVVAVLIIIFSHTAFIKDGTGESSVATDLNVNESGQTYGAVRQEIIDNRLVEVVPDLVEVALPDGRVGYIYKDVYTRVPDVDNPDEALEWEETSFSDEPIYESDGKTQIGWWVCSNGVCRAKGDQR